MSDNVQDAARARSMAANLREHMAAVSNHHPTLPYIADHLDRMADILDPRPVSLRDEVTEAIGSRFENPDDVTLAVVREQADAVLAVVRRRIEALTGAPGIGWDTADHFRHVVLALFDEEAAS